MSNAPFSDEFVFACAKNCLDIVDIQYPDWPKEEVIDTLIAQGDQAAADAISKSLSIVKEEDIEQEPSHTTQKSVTPAPKKAEKSKTKQMELNLFPGLPKPPEQTPKQALQASTALTPPSIVARGYNEWHYGGMNWPNNKNIWTLYAISFLFPEPLTPLQQKDKKELAAAVEEYGNRKLKKIHHSADEIIDARSGEPYIRCGLDTIRAMGKPTEGERNRALSEVKRRHLETQNENNADRISEIITTAKGICDMLRTRYNGK